MHIWTNVTAAHGAEPSPLLIHLAGEFADRIALTWPAPHTPFLTAGANQRHLIALGLSHGPAEADLRGVLETPIKRALRAILPNAPQGLLRAIGRLGEALWTPRDYGLLLAVLHRPEPAKVLAHTVAITPELVAGLNRLPTPLVLAGLRHLGLTADQTALVAEAFTVVESREGPATARRIAERWAASRTLASLLERVGADLTPDLPPPPFPGGPRLRPLASKAAVNDAARRFDNCLRSQAYRAVDGTVAFYEWTGSPPAVIEILLDPIYGWRLEEAKLRNNETMSEADRPALVADLRAMGVHVGRTNWELQNALRAARNAEFRLASVEEAIGWRFDN